MMQESITNEWAEFLAYTKKPAYAVRNKKDNGFFGGFREYVQLFPRGQ